MSSSKKEEIDLLLIIESLYRNKKLIFKSTSITFFISLIYLFLSPATWQGEFQIVLNNINKDKNLITNNLPLNNLPKGIIDFPNIAKDLDTQVEILSSPLVLKPVFEYVKEYKQNKGVDVSNWVYKEWVKEYLNIKLEKGTKILNLSFKNKDKKIIIPTLKKISERYKDFADRDRKTGIDKTINYLESQLKIYRTKSVESLRASQQFAIENNLTALKGDGEIDTEILSVFDIEKIRVKAANDIKFIDQQIKQLEDLPDDKNEFIFRGLVLEELKNEGFYKDIDVLNNTLILKKNYYTDNDPDMKDIEERIKAKVKLLKKRIYGILQAKKANAIAVKLSADRPKGVITKMSELTRQYIRDKKTLDELEKQLQFSLLEKARQEDPWELITSPTLLSKPISPKKGQTIILALMGGFLIGMGSSVRKDISQGTLFNREVIISKMPLTFLSSFKIDKKESWGNSLKLILSGPLNVEDNDGSISFIILGEIEEDIVNLLKNELKKLSTKRKLLFTRDLNESQKSSKQLLIVSPGKISFNDIDILKQQISLLKSEISGWILIE